MTEERCDHFQRNISEVIHHGIDPIVDKRIAIVFLLDAVALLFSNASQPMCGPPSKKGTLDFTHFAPAVPDCTQIVHRTTECQPEAAGQHRVILGDCCPITTFHSVVRVRRVK